MGHAGAIISGGKGTADEKMAAMKKAGIKVIESPAEIGSAMLKAVKTKLEIKTKKSKSKKLVPNLFRDRKSKVKSVAAKKKTEVKSKKRIVKKVKLKKK
jgi:succinyl-CoA synthetase alpha subunit